MQTRWLALTLVAASASAAHAATFDCKAATTAQEKLICATPKLNDADDKMGAAYKAWLAAAPETMHPELLADQRAWLARRNYQCSPSGSTQADLIDCLGLVYGERIDQLRTRVQTIDGITFVSHATRLVSRDTLDNAVSDPSMEQVPGYGTRTATWPMALSQAPEWQKWNAAIELETRRAAAPDRTKSFATWSPRWAAGLDGQTDAYVLSLEHGRVGVHIADYTMEHGGAHGSSTRTNVYWLLTEARPLKATDVFNPGTYWSKPIVDLCAAAIVKQLDPSVKEFFGPRNANIAKVVAAPANWTLLPAGLRISFPEYSVSSFASPADDVTIPWSTLKGYLAKDFVPPQ